MKPAEANETLLTVIRNAFYRMMSESPGLRRRLAPRNRLAPDYHLRRRFASEPWEPNDPLRDEIAEVLIALSRGSNDQLHRTAFQIGQRLQDSRPIHGKRDARLLNEMRRLLSVDGEGEFFDGEFF
jgi:hypothetical protein